LLARINNLTDTAYVLANGYSTPGRNAFVSLSWSM
jgi:outer membrane cobalamin receptor